MNREFLGEKKTTIDNQVVTDRYYKLPNGQIVRERKVETYTKVKF
jgi:hypothetical protein